MTRKISDVTKKTNLLSSYISVAVLVVAIVFFFCGACSSTWSVAGKASSGKAGDSWQPSSIENRVLEAGSKVISSGHGYKRIAARVDDPRPLSAHEISMIFPLKAAQLNSDCAAVVTDRAVSSSLAKGGCSQVLRLVTTASDNSGGHAMSLIEIFNLESGNAVYRAANVFGQKTTYGDMSIKGMPRTPNFPPKGFIRPWSGTVASNVATASDNAAEVDGFGHFLVVIWTFGETNSVIGNDGASSLFDDALSKFASNRALSSS